MSLEQQVANLVEASNNLTTTVNGKIEEIDQSVEQAQKDMNDFIDDSKSVFVNRKDIAATTNQVKVWKVGYVDYKGSGESTVGEIGYLDLIMINGRDNGHQSPRKLMFTAAFRETFSAEHHFVGSLNENYDNGCHFVLCREVGQPEGRYTLYMVQADYCYITLVIMHETTPLSSGLNEMTMLHSWGNTELRELDWDNDVLRWIEQNENLEVAYHTSQHPTAIMSVGKIRYVEMEQITLPVE